MNPRLVLLVAAAASFIAMRSMDEQYQSAVTIARKARGQAAMAGAMPKPSGGTVALLAFETNADDNITDSIALAEHQSSCNLIERTEMGWECFPTHALRDDSRVEIQAQSAPTKAFFISRQSSAPSAMTKGEPDEGEPVVDCSDLECSNEPSCLDEIPMDNLWMFGGIDISLPQDITAGEFRVVSDRGDVRTLTLLPSDLEYHGRTERATPHDLYTVETGGARWYFVRVKREAKTARPATASVDWKETIATIRSKAHLDVQFAVWRWGSAWDKLQRQVNAVNRRSQTWTDAMTQALWHAIRSIESASRLSAEEPKPGSRL